MERLALPPSPRRHGVSLAGATRASAAGERTGGVSAFGEPGRPRRDRCSVDRAVGAAAAVAHQQLRRTRPDPHQPRRHRAPAPCRPRPQQHGGSGPGTRPARAGMVCQTMASRGRPGRRWLGGRGRRPRGSDPGGQPPRPLPSDGWQVEDYGANCAPLGCCLERRGDATTRMPAGRRPSVVIGLRPGADLRVCGIHAVLAGRQKLAALARAEVEFLDTRAGLGVVTARPARSRRRPPAPQLRVRRGASTGRQEAGNRMWR